MSGSFKPDPAAYAEASKPHESLDAANEALRAFSAEVFEARKRHHISTVLLVTVVKFDSDGRVEAAVGSGGCGDPSLFETLAAVALRQAREDRARQIAALAGLERPEDEAG